MTKANRAWLLLGLLGVILTFGLITKCVADAREEDRRKEAIATAEGFAKVIRATLADQTKLVVLEESGALDVTSVNRGTVFDTSEKSTVPYTVAYTVDLSHLNLSDVRFDETTKTMFVQIPNVEVAPPNVDVSKKKILERSGWWFSRDASEKLAYRSAKLALAAATASARKPEKMRKASEAARDKVDHLLEVPLQAAGRKDINVVVRFPTDGGPLSERWDVSPSIEQVLAQKDEID